MATITSVVVIFSVSVSFLVASCPSAEVKNEQNVTAKDSTNLIQSDTAYGCGGTVFHLLDTNSFLVIRFDPDRLQLDADYTFDLSDDNGIVEVYIDKYEEDGIIQSYCSDIIITNALVPIKIPAKSGTLNLRLSTQYIDASVENLEFAESNGKELRIPNKRFAKVIMNTGG